MDFDNLDLRTAAEKTYPIHLRLGGKLLYTDKEETRPCMVTVGSPANPEIEKLTIAVERIGTAFARVELSLARAEKAQERRSIENRLDELNKEAESLLTKFLMKAVVGWENIEKGGKPLPFTEENLADMAQPKAPLFRLAQAIAEDMATAADPFTEADSA